MAISSNGDVLRPYLLGRLGPEARERLEDQLFSDDRVFLERLCIEEEQLIDEYAAGQLDNEAQADFERHFLCTEERRAKLEFVQALRAHIRGQERRRHRSAWEWLGQPIFAPAWSLAVAATLLLALPAAVWQFAAQRTAQSEVSAWLTSGLVRSDGGTLERVRVSGACQVIRFRLEPGLTQYPAYRATLYQATGELLWSQGQLTVGTIDNRAAITLTLPCELLSYGDYYVMLQGLSAGTEPLLLHRYDVRVIRE